MGSIPGGQLGFPNPLNRVAGPKSTDPFKKIQSAASGEDSAELHIDSIQLSSAKALLANQAKTLFFDFNVRATRAILDFTSGKANSSQRFNVQSIEVYGRASVGRFTENENADAPDLEGSLNPLASLQDYFSPENTSNRIFEFALTRYGQGRFEGQDGSENRAAYRDFIFPAIEQGFQEAVNAFGESLSEDVLGELRETLEKVKISFENFVASAPDAGGGELPEPVIFGAPQEAE